MAIFKPLELLLAAVKSYRLNSVCTHICNWPGSVTDFALKLYFEYPQSAESCCCLPWEYDPVTQILLWSKVAMKMETKKEKYNSKLSKFCLAHGRNHSQLVNSAMHQHKRVSGRHCLSGNQVYHSLLVSLETHLHFFPPTGIRVCEWKDFWGATVWENVKWKIRLHQWEVFNISWDLTLTELVRWSVFISISLFFFF